MSTTRREFLIAMGAAGWPSRSSGIVMRASTRIWVVDQDLRQSGAVLRRATRIAALSGDAGWLWFERLSKEAVARSDGIGGITRFADAFVFAQLGAEIGMRAQHHRAWDDGALLWTLEHG
ncbi:hypothetical protein NK8_38640 [Caballeronia sp. NK8]|nr:hypothetical protein NK8_38640 [Caballeronia sp. NK8]